MASSAMNGAGSTVVDTITDALGFTSADREILITLKVKLERMQEDQRDYILRLSRIEADHVTRRDFNEQCEDLSHKVNAESLPCALHSQQVAQHDADLKTIKSILGEHDNEGLRGDVRTMLRYIWIALGGLAALQTLLSLVKK